MVYIYFKMQDGYNDKLGKSTIRYIAVDYKYLYDNLTRQHGKTSVIAEKSMLLYNLNTKHITDHYVSNEHADSTFSISLVGFPIAKTSTIINMDILNNM